jgi:hypothetical protein
MDRKLNSDLTEHRADYEAPQVVLLGKIEDLTHGAIPAVPNDAITGGTA